MRARRAFTLWEMLTVILVLGVAGLIYSRLFVATYRVIDAAPKARDGIVRAQLVLNQMRADVWTAKAFRVDNAKSLHADEITWTIDGDRIVRTTPDQRSEWPGLSVSFESSPAGVLVRNDDRSSSGDDSILMASHANLNRGDR